MEENVKRKLLFMAGLVCDIGILLFIILDWFKIIENGEFVYMPLLGTLMLIQGIKEWENNKKLSVLSLGMAVFVYVASIIKIFIK